ncbi:MAG: hypothetical protein QNJ31_04960 [Candidatus Caenarcaniphilales bacterium]|nr:hypothetical protein [Candidatus Caenarcaniphilales bacterium]
MKTLPSSSINNSGQLQLLNSTAKLESKHPKSRFHEFEANLAGNKEITRVAIELPAVCISTITDLLLGRTLVASTETLIENILWAILGITGPLVLLKHWANFYSNKFIKNDFEITHKNPLETDFQMVDGHFLSKKENQLKLAKHLGIKKLDKIPELAQRIRMGKSSIMGIGLLALTIFSQWVFRFRNFLSEKLSHKKYFPGESNDASEKVLQKEVQDYQKDQNLRRLISLIIGFGMNISVPILYYILISSKNGRGVLGRFKRKIVPKLEYHKAIFMPKLVLLTHTLFNYNFNFVFAFSRTLTEVFEKLRKAIIFDFLFFFGDSIFEGLAGKFFENKYKDHLNGIKLTNKGWFGIPVGKPLHEIQERIQNHKNPKVHELVDKLSRWNFRIGLVSAGVLLGILTEAFNVLATRKRLKDMEKREEEKQLALSSTYNLSV